MPSKAKKNSKSLSRLSNSEQSPRTPTSVPRPDFELGEDDLLCSLDEASSKFPTLLSKPALVGRVTDVDSDSKGCKVWLSESSMTSYNIAPGSIVSVSLPSLRKGFSDTSPLCSLADERSTHFGVVHQEKMGDEAGIYFALATVLPSKKVLKNGVRLSSNLSNTMGCPAHGRVVFVNSIQRLSLPCHINGNGKTYSTRDNCLSVLSCKELHLELVSFGNSLMINDNLVSSEKGGDGSENSFISSPKTPLHQMKISSSNTYDFTSSNCNESLSKTPNINRTSVDSLSIREVLGDESSKKLMQICATSWLYSRCLLRGNLVGIPIFSDLCMFQVINAKSCSADSNNKDSTYKRSYENDAFLINRETRVFMSLPLNLESEIPQIKDLRSANVEASDVGYISKLGGLSKEYAVLRDIIISSSVNDTLSSFGLRTTKGVLLHGPPGTGKTSLALLCARDAGASLFSLKGPEIVGQYYGESEQALLEVFESASRSKPAVIFIDELDAIAPARKDGGEELSQRMVATLLNLMDGISRTDGVLVLAATNRPDSIEPALRRPGRLDREIELGVPSSTQRLDIVLNILNEMEHTLSDAQIQNLAMATHGFVGADLASLCNEAALTCLRRYAKFKKSCDAHEGPLECILEFGILKQTEDLAKDYSDSSLFSGSLTSSETTSSVIDSNLRTCTVEEECTLKVTFEDFERARLKVRPSAMREVILEVPKVNWEDVGGQEEVKTQLMEAVEWPQKHQDALNRIGTRPPTGVLMFGPPGCSKTLMARAVASEARLNFLAVKGPELFSKWVGESEKAVRSLFAKARANAPSIIFFDEIDALAVTRGKDGDGISVADRVMSQLLVELDGLHQRVNVTVVAATNRPDKIDPALLRPGRFDRLLYVGPPNETDREAIFRIHLRKIPCSYDVSLRELACLTEGCTGADISLICREAAVAAIEENLEASEVTMAHLRGAVKQVQPSEVDSYSELVAKFQRHVLSTGKSP